MSFDNGNGPVVVQSDLSPVEQLNRDAALKDYFQQVEDIQAKKAAVQAEIDALDIQITDRRKLLEELYNKKVEDLGDQVTILTEEKDQLLASLNDLENDIKVKSTERDAILVSLASQQKDLDLQKDKITADAASILIAKTDLNDRELTVEELEKIILQKQNELVRDTKNHQAQAEAVQKNLDDQKLLLEQKTSDITGRENMLAARERDVIASENELASKLADAKILLDQAATVRQQLAEVNEKIDRVNAQEIQVHSDINQLQVAKVAIEDKREEINSREAAVKIAEERILKGGK